MSKTNDAHRRLRDAVEFAGLHTSCEDDVPRIVIASNREAHCLTGNSFWAAFLRGEWYLGTWGGLLYRLPEQDRIDQLCINWLQRVPRGTRSDFDQNLKSEYNLEAISHEDFDRAQQSETDDQ